MTTNPSAAGSTQSMSESRAQVLQALLNSLSPGAQADEGGKLNPDQVRKISDKLGEILGEDAMPDIGRRNEKGELVNEEGLPIVDIVEPVSGESSSGPSGFAAPFGDTDLIPLWKLSPEERARRRAWRDRILDLLEEEEQKEEAKERERFKAELEKRKQAAIAEMEEQKKARELQKKMGKALLQNMAAAREREEKERRAIEEAEEQAREERRKLKPRKSVSFADLPPDHEKQPAHSVDFADWRDVAPAKLNPRKSTPITREQTDKLPMKMNVVERTPACSRPPKSPPPPALAQADSDDESVSDSLVPADSGDGEIIHSDHSDGDDVPPSPAHDGSEESDIERIGKDEPVEWDIEDYDFAQHQREIALAYYEKRAAMGAEALAAMRNHEHHEGENEWDQPVVPLEATLASSPPKPSVSRFKASLASGSTLPSHSLDGSILPSSQTSRLKSSVRLGKLENGQLVGGEEGESGDELDPQSKEMLEMLRKGEIVNVGPTLPAGETATSLQSIPTPPQQAPLAPAEPLAQPCAAQKPNPSKVSQFKISLAQSTSAQSPLSSAPGSSLSTPTSIVERSSPKLGSRSGTGTPIQVPAKTSRPSPSSSKAPEQLPPQMPGMAVDSPAFSAPGQRFGASKKPPMQMPGMIVDSPSFPAPGVVSSPSFPRPADSVSPSASSVFHSVVLESPSSPGPSSATVSIPARGVAAASPSPPAPTPPALRTPVGATVLERKPPMVGAVREPHASGTSGSTVPRKEKKVSRFAAERM
ncbi:hypothetical protein BD414DRAFT_438892 [Trametes punicea]|nr:hypothetical protein BD414DRAFT_438892 [Trametes punicea]